MNELDSQQEQSAATEPWPSPGRMLRQLRESRGMSQAQVGDSLHLTIHYINALENDQYQKLPGMTFAKGYLKTYAALLGGDVDEVVERFEQLTAEREESMDAQRPPHRAPPRHDHREHGMAWMMSAGVLLVAVLGIAWWFGREEPVSAPAPRAVNPAQLQNAASPPRGAGEQAPVTGSRARRANSAEALMNATRLLTPGGRTLSDGEALPEPLPQRRQGQDRASDTPDSTEP